MWEAIQRSLEPAPILVRRSLAATFKAHDHRVILMEDDPDRAGEDLIEKLRVVKALAKDPK